MDDYIYVCYCLNKTYELYTINSIQSLIDNNVNQNKYYVYIIHDGSINYENCINQLELDDNVIIDFIYFDKPQNFYCDSYIQKPAYYRLFLAELLPCHIDKCIYLDCDTLILNSLDLLYNININSYVYGMVKYQKPKWEDHPYNDGVLLVNLAKIRKDNIVEKYTIFMNEHKYLKQHDETVINLVHKDDVKVISNIFNYFNIPPNADQNWLNIVKDNVYILHDLSSNKLLLNNMIYEKYIKNRHETKYPVTYYKRNIDSSIRFSMATSSPKNYYGFSDTYENDSPLQIKFYDYDGYGNYYIQFISYHWDNSNYSKYHHRCINLIPMNYSLMHPDEMAHWNDIKSGLINYISFNTPCHYCDTDYTFDLKICDNDDEHDYDSLACKTCGKFDDPQTTVNCTHDFDTEINRCKNCGVWEWFTKLTDEQKKWDEYKGCLDKDYPKHIINPRCKDADKCVYIRELCFYCSKPPRINGLYKDPCTKGHRFDADYCIHCGLNNNTIPCSTHNYEHKYNDQFICKNCNKYRDKPKCVDRCEFKTDHCVKCGLRTKRCSQTDEWNERCDTSECIFDSEYCLTCGIKRDCDLQDHTCGSSESGYVYRCMVCNRIKISDEDEEDYICDKHDFGKNNEYDYCSECELKKGYTYECTYHVYKERCKDCGLIKGQERCEETNRCKWCGVYEEYNDDPDSNPCGEPTEELKTKGKFNCDICGLLNGTPKCKDGECKYVVKNCKICNKFEHVVNKCEVLTHCDNCGKEDGKYCYKHVYECKNEGCTEDKPLSECVSDSCVITDCGYNNNKCGNCKICGYDGKAICEDGTKCVTCGLEGVKCPDKLNCNNCNKLYYMSPCTSNTCKKCGLNRWYQPCTKTNCNICGLKSSEPVECSGRCSICKKYNNECKDNYKEQCVQCGLYKDKYNCDGKNGCKYDGEDPNRCSECGVYKSYYGNCEHIAYSKHEIYLNDSKYCKLCGYYYGSKQDCGQCDPDSKLKCDFQNIIEDGEVIYSQCSKCGLIETKTRCENNKHDYSNHSFDDTTSNKGKQCSTCGFIKDSKCDKHDYSNHEEGSICINCGFIKDKTECDEHNYDYYGICIDCGFIKGRDWCVVGHNYKPEVCAKCQFDLGKNISCETHDYSGHTFVEAEVKDDEESYKQCSTCGIKYEYETYCPFHCYRMCAKEFKFCDLCKHKIDTKESNQQECLAVCKTCNDEYTTKCDDCGLYKHVIERCKYHVYDSHKWDNGRCENCNLKKYVDKCTPQHQFRNCVNCNQRYNSDCIHHNYSYGYCSVCNKKEGVNCDKCNYGYCIICGIDYKNQDCDHSKRRGICKRCKNTIENLNEACPHCDCINNNPEIQCCQCGLRRFTCNHNFIQHDYEGSSCLNCGFINGSECTEHKYLTCDFDESGICRICGIKLEEFYNTHKCEYDEVTTDNTQCLICGCFRDFDVNDHQIDDDNNNYTSSKYKGHVYRKHIYEKEICIDCNNVMVPNCNHPGLSEDKPCDKCGYVATNCEHKNKKTIKNKYECVKCGKYKRSYGECNSHDYNTCKLEFDGCFNCGRYKGANKQCEHSNETWNCQLCNIKQNYNSCNCVYETNYCLTCGLIRDKTPCIECNTKSKICLNCGYNSVKDCKRWEFKFCNCQDCWRFHKNYNTYDDVHDSSKGFDECACGYDIEGKDTMVCLICSYPSHAKFDNKCTHENNWFGKCLGCLKPSKLKCGDCDYGFEKTIYCIGCGQRNPKHCNFCNYIKPCEEDGEECVFKGGECIKCSHGQTCNCSNLNGVYCDYHKCEKNKRKCYICVYDDETGVCKNCGNIKNNEQTCKLYRYENCKCENCNVTCTHRDNLNYNNYCMICGKTVYDSMGNLEQQYTKQTNEIKQLISQLNTLMGYLNDELTINGRSRDISELEYPGNSKNFVDSFYKCIDNNGDKMTYNIISEIIGQPYRKEERNKRDNDCDDSNECNLIKLQKALENQATLATDTLGNLKSANKTVGDISTIVDGIYSTLHNTTISKEILEEYLGEKNTTTLMGLVGNAKTKKRTNGEEENETITITDKLLLSILLLMIGDETENVKNIIGEIEKTKNKINFDQILEQFKETKEKISQSKSSNRVQLSKFGCTQMRKIIQDNK